MTTHVWIAQCLCPQRHCIMASAGEADSAENATTLVAWPLREFLERALQGMTLNPRCGLCRAAVETWRYEVNRTRFRTMDEARPLLAQLEAEQIAVAALFADDAPPGTLH